MTVAAAAADGGNNNTHCVSWQNDPLNCVKWYVFLAVCLLALLLIGISILVCCKLASWKRRREMSLASENETPGTHSDYDDLFDYANSGKGRGGKTTNNNDNTQKRPSPPHQRSSENLNNEAQSEGMAKSLYINPYYCQQEESEDNGRKFSRDSADNADDASLYAMKVY